MKTLIVLILLLLALCGAILYFGMGSPKKKAPATTANPSSTAPSPAVTQNRQPATSTAAGQTGAAGASAPAREQRTALGIFTDYATGYTPLKVKQHSQKKIQNIQKAENQRIEKALGQ